MTTNLVHLWIYERDYSDPDTYGEWHMVREYMSTVVPRIGETISNKPGFRRVIGIDYVFNSGEMDRVPIVSVYVTRAEKRGLVER